MIQVIDNFAAIESDWHDLYQSGKYSPFQSFDYNKTAFEIFLPKNIELYILCYKNSSNITQAILPTYLQSGVLRFINDTDTDFCDIILDETVKKHDLFSDLVSYIRNDKRIRTVSLDNICVNSPLLPYVKTYLRSASVYCINEYSYLDCDRHENVYDNFSNLNNEKKKKLKKIVTGSQVYDFRVYRHGCNEFPSDKLSAIFRMMVKRNLRSSNTFSDSFWHFAESCYNKNLLEIGILENDEGPVSAGMVFCNDHMSVRWVILYTEAKYNLWNNTRYIVDKCSSISDRFEINFGRGGYDYKINNFKPELSLLYRISYSKTMMGNASAIFKAAFSLAKPVIKQILHR